MRDQPHIHRQCADCHYWDGRCVRLMNFPTPATGHGVDRGCSFFLRASLHEFFRQAGMLAAS